MTATTAETRAADLLVLAAAMPPEQIEGALANLAEAFSARQRDCCRARMNFAAQCPSPLRIVPAPRSGAGWTLKPADFINAYEIAREHEARAVLMLGPGADSLSPPALRDLADAVLNAATDLAMPHYTLPPNSGFINSAILYPLTRALFAARARFPLALDLGLSMRMAERLAAAAQRFSAPGQDEAIAVARE